MNPRLTRARAVLLLPLLTLCLWCKSGDESSPSSGATGGSGPPLTNSGPSADGGVVDDAALGAEDLDAAQPSSGDASGPCDDMKGDFGPCTAIANGGPAAGCLTQARCQSLPQTLLPHSAALAMSCLAGLDPSCPSELAGDCVLDAAGLACSLGAPGAPPCDAVAALCASGDPYGLVSGCPGLAAALTPSAKTSFSACLGDGGTCDPETLEACAAALVP